jgi:hypothetical protein
VAATAHTATFATPKARVPRIEARAVRIFKAPEGRLRPFDQITE